KANSPIHRTTTERDEEWGLSVALETPKLLVHGPSAEIKVGVTSHGGEVRDVAVYSGGTKQCYARAPGGAQFEARCRIKLEPGANTIVVLARSRTGTVHQSHTMAYRME